MVKAYIYLLVAILSEVAASTALRATKGFTQLVPSIITIVGYAVSFYALSHTLTYFKLGITYAIWSGIGMVLITILGFLVYRQKLDWPALLGIALIIAGVVVIQLFSEQAA
ncbi:MAG: SMR family transporter [Anaerolineales bacterium]